jgi:MFS transporter, DHA1 family, multidrug resistance protein
VKNRLLIIILACLSMLGAFSTDTYLPSFRSIAAEFQIGLDVVQQTLTVYLLSMAVMTLFHGTLSDAVGRRPVILGGLVIYLAASIGASFAGSFSFLLLCRLVQGMSAGVGMVVGRAMVRDRFSGPEAQTVMSYTTVVFGLAPVLAPILGGWLEVVLGWRSVFGFLSAFGFLLLVACTLKLAESLPPPRRSPLHLRATLKDYATVGSDPRFLLQSLAIALAASALFIYISAAPVFILQILHLSETSFAWLFVPMIAGIMVGSLAAGRVAHFWRPERTIRIGFFIMTGAAIANVVYAALFTVAIPWAVIPIMLCTFGMAFVSPAMTILTLDLYPSRRGMAASLQSAFAMGAFSVYSGLVVPLLFGSALKLACGVLAGYLASVAFWVYGQGHSLSSRPTSASRPACANTSMTSGAPRSKE